MNKKGQDLSISTIVIAAIAVVVLVVLVAVFTSKIGDFTTGTSSIDPRQQADLILTKCIPAEKYYSAIYDAENKVKKDSKKQGELDTAIREYDNVKTTCKGKNTKASCDASNSQCQWKG